jgi:hypothetical protein
MALGNTYSATYKTQTLTFKFSNNKKAGAGATVTVKGGGVFKGKAKKNSSGGKLGYSVIPHLIEDYTVIPVLTDEDFKYINGKKTQYLNYGDYGEVYAVLNADEKGKNGAGTDRPKVSLYQAYYKNKKDADNYCLSLMPIKADQYKAVPGTKYGENAVEVLIEQNGNPLITGIEIGTNVRLSAPYTVYDSKAVIESAVVSTGEKEYTVGIGQIPDIVYTGSRIRPYIKSVRLSDGTELGPDDVYAAYGYNVTSGNKNGSITITLRYNGKTGSFKYGGSQTFKFNIVDAPGVVL